MTQGGYTLVTDHRLAFRSFFSRLMIVPPHSTSQSAYEALLDLMPPGLLQQLVEYQLEESPELDWEQQHIQAAAEMCTYIDMMYGPSYGNSALVRAAKRLRKRLSIESNE